MLCYVDGQSFRYAGSMFIRLEFLGVYYSQDPARGGKTLQAFGSALLSYLHALQVMDYIFSR